MTKVQRRRRYMLEILPLALIGIAITLYILFPTLSFSTLEQQMRLHNADIGVAKTDDGVQYLRLQLDDSFDAPRTLCFYSVFQSVEVRLNGEEIYRFNRPAGERHMKATPSIWNQVELPANSGGAWVEIELYAPYRQYADFVPQIRSGSRENAERYVLLQTMPRFVLALAILFIGLIFAIVAIVVRYYIGGITGLYSLSLFIIGMAAFLVFQQTSILIQINPNVSYILLQNLAFLLCPVLYTRYLARIHPGRIHKFALGLHIVSIANAAVVIALQALDVCDMQQTIAGTRNLSAVIIAFVFLMELRNRRRVLVCLFALLMIYAAFLYYFTDSVTWLVYAGLFGYLYIMLYRVICSIVRSQAKQIRLETALEVSRSEIATIQITSHFFYHTLDSIRALIRLDADRAYKMAGDFAKYVRHRVDGVERMQETVPFSRELRSIRAYTDIKQAQLGDRFEMVYDVENEDFDILPLTVQPMVENAVIHAVQRRRHGGWVRLCCRETQQGYHIEVIDNGPGENAAPEISDAQRESVAVRNVNTRLEYYGIAPLQFKKNELGGMTVSLDTPKKIVRKGSAE